MIACYSYSDASEDYGTYQKSKFKDEEVESYVCPVCQSRIPDEAFAAAEMNEFAPDEDDVNLHSAISEAGPTCIECGVQLDKELQKTKLIIPRMVGFTSEPKSRVCLEVYGGLYVKVANYAKKQCDTPYLDFSYETHYSNALEMYPELREKIPQGGWNNSGPNDMYETQGRLNTQYRGEYPTENVTVKNMWLRVSSFNILPEDDYLRLKRLFPDGAKVVLVNDTCAEYLNESLDDHWTLTHNPMSDFINHEPLGELLTNIQDIINDLISLTLQTIEHGIAQTFADPAVVNFNAQRQIEATPGTLTPTKPVGGNKSISEGFYNLQTASLSPEIFSFYRIIQELGQFVSGALPSLFGGQAGGNSSGTASEYAMSKAMALQRLQTPWKMLTIWWKEIFGKVIPLYMKNMVEDERMVQKDDQGNFINVFIRKAETDGRIGSIELEPDEKLPITDEQQADMIMQIMQLNNEALTAALMSPENIPFVKKVIKIPEFTLPGEDDRQKQYEEIVELVNSAPVAQPIDEMQIAEAMQTGIEPEPIELPSVMIDPDVDNHMIEADICRSWLVGDAGRLAKVENPNGYKNVLLHMKAHKVEIARLEMLQLEMQSQQQTMQQETQNAGKENKAKPKQSEKVSGENNVRSPIS